MNMTTVNDRETGPYTERISTDLNQRVLRSIRKLHYHKFIQHRKYFAVYRQTDNALTKIIRSYEYKSEQYSGLKGL
jgi:hypothetical protein